MPKSLRHRRTADISGKPGTKSKRVMRFDKGTSHNVAGSCAVNMRWSSSSGQAKTREQKNNVVRINELSDALRRICHGNVATQIMQLHLRQRACHINVSRHQHRVIQLIHMINRIYNSSSSRAPNNKASAELRRRRGGPCLRSRRRVSPSEASKGEYVVDP